MATQPHLGEIIVFAGNFVPRGWMSCDGQSLLIKDHEDLHAILGTAYGGDGKTTFALPDMRGRIPMHRMANSDTKLVPGGKGGALSVVVEERHMPEHRHYLLAGKSADTASPANASITRQSGDYAKQTMGAAAISSTGGGEPLDIRNPFLGLTFIIAVMGQ